MDTGPGQLTIPVTRYKCASTAILLHEEDFNNVELTPKKETLLSFDSLQGIGMCSRRHQVALI